MPAVSGLSEEFPGRVTSENLDATDEDGKRAVAELGFASHGLVIRSADGKVVFKQADHAVDIAQVRSALREMVGP